MNHVGNALRSAILALSLAFSFGTYASGRIGGTVHEAIVVRAGTRHHRSPIGRVESYPFHHSEQPLVATGVLNGTVTSATGTVSNLPMLPLKRGGADSPGNMQWQTKADAKAKDAVE